MDHHAIVAKAVDQRFEAALADDPSIRDTRPYLIHANQIRECDLQRAGRLGVIINMQPTIQSIIADALPACLGSERAERDWPFTGALKAGVCLASSSDLPVTYPNWREGVQTMLRREGVPSGKVSGPAECIGIEDAIRTYTINGARQDRMEHLKGSIEVGKLADFAVLDADILTVDPHTIKQIGVDMTVVGGQVVYEKAAEV
ncbi:MAG: amidohydrolase family protein [Actinobacteria bacterium]|nr:amidohydrolase family protein [Actinomycetota bacterium]